MPIFNFFHFFQCCVIQDINIYAGISFNLPFISHSYNLINSHLESVFVFNVFAMAVHLCFISNKK